MSPTKHIFYAAVGAGDLAIERARRVRNTLDLSAIASSKPAELRASFERAGAAAAETTTKLFDALVGRGQQTVATIRSSEATRRAVAQSKTAKAHTKAAMISVRQAAKTSVSPSKEFAQR